MNHNHSIEFFDSQFRNQTRQGEFKLNPFELAAIPHVTGRVLDFGCGLGNFSFAAAQRGCSVLALDGSPTAIAHVRKRAVDESLPVRGELADLRDYAINEEYDTVVSIGLLMFFDCPTAFKILLQLQNHVREGGIAVVNVLVQGTTYFEMFDKKHYCLFDPDDLDSRFTGWAIIHREVRDFVAPKERNKAFATIIAQKSRVESCS